MLQMLGFTKNTTLYTLYERLPEFVAVLVHSYFDYGFMSQVGRLFSNKKFYQHYVL